MIKELSVLMNLLMIPFTKNNLNIVHLIVISISSIFFLSCNESNSSRDKINCSFINSVTISKFSEQEWNNCSNYDLIYASDEESIKCLFVREGMLCSMLDKFLMKVKYDTVKTKLGKPDWPSGHFASSLIHNDAKALYYPVGFSGFGPNCLVLYFNEQDILYDYQNLISQ